MISVKVQLKRHMTKMVKTITNDFRLDFNIGSGVIYYKSNLIMNYFDSKVFFKYDSSTNDYNSYKLNIQLDFDKLFDSINNTTVTIKE